MQSLHNGFQTVQHLRACSALPTFGQSLVDAIIAGSVGASFAGDALLGGHFYLSNSRIEIRKGFAMFVGKGFSLCKEFWLIGLVMQHKWQLMMSQI